VVRGGKGAHLHAALCFDAHGVWNHAMLLQTVKDMDVFAMVGRRRLRIRRADRSVGRTGPCSAASVLVPFLRAGSPGPRREEA
jgi:hypothetical protein